MVFLQIDINKFLQFVNGILAQVNRYLFIIYILLVK